MKTMRARKPKINGYGDYWFLRSEKSRLNRFELAATYIMTFVTGAWFGYLWLCKAFGLF